MHYYYRYQRKYYLLGDQKKSVSSISCKNVNIIIPADMSPETQTVDGNDAISPKPLTFHSEFDKFLLLKHPNSAQQPQGISIPVRASC
jgi:hypothetical protein